MESEEKEWLVDWDRRHKSEEKEWNRKKDRDHIISGSDNRLAFSVYICDLLLF